MITKVTIFAKVSRTTPIMKKLITSLSIILISFSSYTQMGSLSLTFGLPQNEFRENTDATGFGGDLSLAFPFQKGVPIYLGGDINYMVYGLNSQDHDLTAEIVANGQVIDELIIPLTVTNTNSIFGTHLFMRAVAPFELIQPYAEGLIGFRYISTNTKIIDRSDDRRWADDDDSDVISRKTVLDDWIFSYGYGGGFLIKVGPSVFVDLRADFFKGQRAQYYDGDDTESWTVEFNGDPNNYDRDTVTGDDLSYENQPRESTTDLLVLKFGVAFKI
ncbi:hypothetical protein SAMN05421640_2850 [Ekhidna lutea]|uniref:Outer membrane protein beta-barrel domain-containing protein n=2 Tax=Ekhidna lutea TaxID=447679 RepID=A0A239KQF1_EKHLU|nr:hypothetical protein SAMN05421640_2850 [Ekhidna lutea]